MKWWRLPGPFSFVGDIANDLRLGKNVVVCLPKTAHLPGFRATVRELMDDDGSWQNLSCYEMGNLTPLDWLYDCFPDPQSSPMDLRSTRKLVQNPSFAGHVLWLEDGSESTWLQWQSFIAEYEPLCRGVEPLSRTVICFLLVGDVSSVVPSEDVCLSVRKFEGRVSHLDMQLYVSSQSAVAETLDVLDELRLEIISSVALWDGELAESLLRKDLAELLNLSEWLRDEAKSRNWDSQSTENGSSWNRGIVNYINGKLVFHSCICALNNPNELRRRIWRAQVRVLYPFVEEQRQIILRLYEPYLRLAFTNKYGETIKDLYDLEIGHIESILGSHRRFNDPDLMRRIKNLKKIRNGLSHLEIVDFSILSSTAVQHPLSLEAAEDC